MNHLDKISLRGSLLARRRGLSSKEAARLSLAAQKNVLGQPAWNKARVVMLYAHSNGETATDLLIRTGLDQGKRVLLPRCRRDIKGVMDAAGICCMEDLAPGLYGILEPDSKTCPVEINCLPDLLIIPAVAYDHRGCRLGYGGGYYDRFLTRFDSLDNPPTLLGLAYDFQILESLPAESWDRSVHCICTEEGCHWTPW